MRKAVMWWFYFNDIFTIKQYNQEKLNYVLYDINNRKPNIRFTLEIKKKVAISWRIYFEIQQFVYFDPHEFNIYRNILIALCVHLKDFL